MSEKDPNEFARSIFDQIIAKHDPEDAREKGKDPKKVAAGLRGGAKGGQARAGKLSAKKRSAIAKKAVNTRWEKQN